MGERIGIDFRIWNTKKPPVRIEAPEDKPQSFRSWAASTLGWCDGPEGEDAVAAQLGAFTGGMTSERGAGPAE